LGLLWQIIKIQLLSQISLKNFPELVMLLGEGELFIIIIISSSRLGIIDCPAKQLYVYLALSNLSLYLSIYVLMQARRCLTC
jgi:hypothetical protein